MHGKLKVVVNWAQHDDALDWGITDQEGVGPAHGRGVCGRA